MRRKYHWAAVYAAAVLETDNSKIQHKIMQAELAIQARINSEMDYHERRAIQNACKVLKALIDERTQPSSGRHGIAIQASQPILGA